MKEQIEKEFNDIECSKCNVHFTFCQSAGTYEKCYNKFLISKLVSTRQEIEKSKEDKKRIHAEMLLLKIAINGNDNIKEL